MPLRYDPAADSVCIHSYGIADPAYRVHVADPSFETRDPAAKAWLEWTRERSYERIMVPGVGGVRSWVEALDVGGDLVSFRGTVVFESDGAVLTSDSTIW
jgi:hypothetical protein